MITTRVRTSRNGPRKFTRRRCGNKTTARRCRRRIGRCSRASVRRKMRRVPEATPTRRHKNRMDADPLGKRRARRNRGSPRIRARRPANSCGLVSTASAMDEPPPHGQHADYERGVSARSCARWIAHARAQPRSARGRGKEDPSDQIIENRPRPPPPCPDRYVQADIAQRPHNHRQRRDSTRAVAKNRANTSDRSRARAPRSGAVPPRRNQENGKTIPAMPTRTPLSPAAKIVERLNLHTPTNRNSAMASVVNPSMTNALRPLGGEERTKPLSARSAPRTVGPSKMPARISPSTAGWLNRLATSPMRAPRPAGSRGPRT